MNLCVCVAQETLDWPQSPGLAPRLTPIQRYAAGGKTISLPLEQYQHMSTPGSSSLNIKDFKSDIDNIFIVLGLFLMSPHE